MITTAKRLDGIGEYYFSQKLREIEQLNKEGKDIINLGIGSPDLPPHPDVIKTLETESDKLNVHAYQGYKGIAAFRLAIADWYRKVYGVQLNADENILPLIGSKEGIMHICMTYLNEGDGVLVPNPGYPTYRSAVTLAGGNCIDYVLKEKNNWFPDFEQLEALVSPSGAGGVSSIKLMWVNYPQMPTGQLPTHELFEKLIAFGKKHKILICHDNPYSFILNEKPESILSINGALDVCVELNSLSKSHNMAGWRVGMLCGKKQRIDEILRFKSNMDSGMFMPVQLAAAKALSLENDWYTDLNKVYAERKRLMIQIPSMLNCSYDDKQAGMFIWCKMPAGYKNAYELSDEILYKANVFLTPGGIFGSNGDNYIRLSLCSKEEKIKEAINRIQNYLQTK
jgi:LL-diaminopimelate aminotransferase